MDLLCGHVLTKDGIIEGSVTVEGGKIIDISEGRPDGRPIAEGFIIPPLVNSHTHCADGGLRVEPGTSLEDLVAPPNGLKHRYLEGLSDESLLSDMASYSESSENNGIGTFIDFREGGAKGCRLLRRAFPGACILGRPLSAEYDIHEVEEILSVADGIGVSSISDMGSGYLESLADHARSSGKIFAIHASEREREDIDSILSLDPAFIVHMTEATDSDLLKCAEAEVPAVICARSNLFFGRVPPIKRMMDFGVDIALGTDNAMLCGPDLRAEASAFRDVLLSQGGDDGSVLEQMLYGRKILYHDNKFNLSVGMDADMTVFPYEGDFTAKNILKNEGRIFRYNGKKRGST